MIYKKYDSETFELKDVDIDVPEEIVEAIQNGLNAEEYTSTPYIVSDDEKGLSFAMFKSREPGGPLAKRYKVTITPIK